jgi:GntR family transcriptional regulator
MSSQITAANRGTGLAASASRSAVIIMKIDPTGPELAYVQVADDIAGRIGRGELRSGDRLPPERELADDYGVSYDTIRRAAEVLRERGLIQTVHGKGTFVA